MKTNKKNTITGSGSDIIPTQKETINNPVLKVLNKVGLYNVETYDEYDDNSNNLTEIDYNKVKSKSRFRRLFRMGVDPKAPSVFENEIPRANIPDEITDKTMRDKLEKNVNSIYELYSKDILPWPQMLDVRMYIVGLMHESIQWTLRSKKEKENYKKSKDLWMFLHWHFPIVFMWFFYNILGTYKLELMNHHGITDENYIMTELSWVVFYAAALAWLLDFVWEPIECTIYDIVIYYAPYSHFSKGFGRETRTNSVTVDPVVSGLFGILFMVMTIILTDQRPMFGVRDVECWVQFFILWFLPMSAGKSIPHLIFYTLLESTAIFLLQYLWIEVELAFVITWIVGAMVMSVIIGIGGLSFYRKVPTLISEPIYTAVLIGLPCHIIYFISVNIYISQS